LSLAGALTYGELAAAFPEAGGEYVYLRKAYGPLFGYLYGWTQLWVAKSGSIATLASGFYVYLTYFWPGLSIQAATFGGQKVVWGQILAVGIIGGLSLVNYFGVRAGGNLQVATTILKVVLIGIIIAAALFSGAGQAANLQSSIPATAGITGFFAALVGALWAYDGWNNVTMVASEIKDPQRNLPRALVAGTLAVVAIYLLINFGYFYVLSASEVASADRVAASLMQRITGPIGATAVTVAALITIFSALNGAILTGARVPYAMARDGLFFGAIARLHPQHATPGASLLLLGAWSSVLVLSGTFDQLANYVVFASWLLYGMAGASVIVLRRKLPDVARPYRVWGYPWVPVIFVAVAAMFVVSTAITSRRESLIGLFLILAGLPLYFYWKRQPAPRV
jgi:amino acid transporter